ncbi:helix-turn-helix domain-containing protein [Micromonospora endolithica]|uniref:Helix-turn-helix domain-containing protein n=1 Tax=Micromonospora endolithica TaxID=230091 RepID=A0A3A9ZK38_9ACTN|nr:helix-turn-helix domain-containing protein [Micromonospora endolithica]RKN48579.1 helix-turn-helix domain-containing protein [Micromonospora endolithica]TWJ22092.1 AraC family transcriptional regulator [Micromonospora endolithica]
MYRERAAATLAGAVVWTSRVRSDVPPTRVLPDGCLDLLWSSRRGLLVAGPDRAAHLSSGTAGERWLGLRLPPGVGPAVFGVPADELRDRRVPLDALWGAAAGEIAERLGDRPTAAALEAVAAVRLAAAGGPDPRGVRVAATLAAGATVAATAAEVGLTPRALHRLSQALFGYGPKTLARILRMRRALDLARAGAPLAEVAVRAGYADQAHLTRDVSALAGVPPTVLLG